LRNAITLLRLAEAPIQLKSLYRCWNGSMPIFKSGLIREIGNIIHGFRNRTLLRQLVAFQKRFRRLELPLAEIRPENASNAGMLQSGMSRPAKYQKIPPGIDAPPSCWFTTIMRPKTEKLMAMLNKLIAVDIF